MKMFFFLMVIIIVNYNNPALKIHCVSLFAIVLLYVFPNFLAQTQPFLFLVSVIIDKKRLSTLTRSCLMSTASAWIS